MAVNVLAGILVAMPVVCLYANRGLSVLFILACLAGLIPLVRTRRGRWPLGGAVTVFLAAFLVWGAASAGWEVFPGLALRRIVELVGVALGGVVLTGVALSLSEAQRDTVLRAVAIGLGAAFVLAVIDVETRMAFSDALFRLVGSPKSMNMLVVGRFKPSASVSALLGLLAFGVALHLRRFGLAAVVAVATVGLSVVSNSLAASLGLLVGGMVAAAGLIHRRLGTAVAAGLIIVLFAGAPVLQALPSSEVLLHRYPWLPNSANHRAMIWTFVAEKVAERPVLGWGLDSSREVGGQETRELWTRVDKDTLRPMEQSVLPLHPHNFVLQIWLETGAIGAGLVVGLLLALLALAARQPGRLRMVCESTLAASIAVALVSFGIWQSWWMSSLWLVAVLAAALCRPPIPGVPASS